MTIIGCLLFIVLGVLTNILLLPLIARIMAPLSSIAHPVARGIASGVFDALIKLLQIWVIFVLFKTSPWVLWGIDLVWVLWAANTFKNPMAIPSTIISLAVFITIFFPIK